jgi:hypothetical protein
LAKEVSSHLSYFNSYLFGKHAPALIQPLPQLWPPVMQRRTIRLSGTVCVKGISQERSSSMCLSYPLPTGF